MGQRVQILIVDDHVVVRKGLAMVLRLEPDFEVVGEAGDGRKALEMAQKLRPNLVLLDLFMPGMSGMETAAALRQNFPQTRILVLSGAELEDGLVELLAGGVDGYVLKDIEPEDLKQAIRAVARGEAYLHPRIARRVLDCLADKDAPPAQPPFTPRELEILRWMSTPATYREIAGKLVISEETVRSHAKHILNKLGQPNRVQAVLAAVRMGVIELPEEWG